jgi:transcriptional regulator with PAS, ATPase and Fis domain
MSGIFFSIFIIGIVRALLYSDTSIPFYVLYFLLEHKILGAIAFYNILILIPYAVFEGIVILNTKSMPKILTQQVKACINFFLIPHFIANFWQTYPFNQQTFHPEALVLSEIFLLLAIFYFAKTIIGLRFLNLHSHVHDTREFNFIYDFKTMLEDLGQVTNITEIKILSQQFFNKAFHIDPQKIHLGIITIYHPNEKDFSPRKISTLQSRIETFLSQENFAEYTDESGTTGPIQILIYDEIAYTHFHEPTDFTQRLLTFLHDIDADVFLPMYDQDRIIGYIIINKNKSRKELYTNIERDEMIVFSTYAAKIVNLLQNRNLNELLKERKEILEELYTKHQEITKYKESVQSFLKINKGNSIGIILYKNKTFSFANEDANKILGVNPNTEKGAPAVKILTSLASKIESYKAPQLQFAKNIHNKRFVISGIPHPDNNSVIITLYYPELSDVIEELIDRIKDPSDWDYLLYLETTESGQLINNLIPGNSELLINFKIELLKVALTKKALLINVPENDVISMVELIHHISLKENLHILNLQTPITTQETGITLFGINPLFAISAHNEMLKDPLLEKLNKKGTLFIKNIHFLDLESQINLANFIRYGFYKVLKSERKMFGDVRIICSTNQNLEDLAKQGLFSELLLRELQNTSLNLPTLLTLPANEIETLIQGFTEQALNSNNATNKLLAFSDKDREHLIAQRPVSLHDLKESIRDLLLMKSKKTDLYEETTFDAAYNISDPKLAEAVRLGKYALKDPMIMAMLWNKFQNQNKIATFLGVNRSSVHRRCKDYGIF